MHDFGATIGNSSEQTISFGPGTAILTVVESYRCAHQLQLKLHELHLSSPTADSSWLELAEEAEVFERKLLHVIRTMQRVLDSDTTSFTELPEIWQFK